MSEDPLETPLQYLPGCGPDRAELFARLGLRTVADLLWHLPREVLDLTHISDPSELVPDVVQTVRGVVIDRDSRPTRNNRTLTKILIDCGSESVRGTWFNQPWILRKYQLGNVVTFAGKPKRHQGRWEFTHPIVQELQNADDETGGEMLARYGLTEGLQQDHVRRVMRTAIERFADAVPEHLPDAFREKHDLLKLSAALRAVHLPESSEEYKAGLRRILFDDLFEFQLGLALRRRVWRKRHAAPVLPTTAKIDARIRRLFPFQFTDGQNQAVEDITRDLASGQAMHRLLQADVGAGKTAVAIYAMLVAIAAGYQAVLMAPTEVLASQHWATFDAALSHSRVKRVFLTGQLTVAQRRRVLDDIRVGATQLVVGTQAVIQEGVRFGRLGVAVIDEQHKFGVMQRAGFSTDEETSPHVLVMTATPIPRSICLTQFGDLDVTAITDRPPGRQKILTSRVIGPQSRERAWKFIKEQLQNGRQAYVVCPRVASEETTNGSDTFPPPASDTNALSASAEDVYEQLRSGELADFQVGLVHGQLDRQVKANAMDAFREGETQVLVSTTVVEVGVDVPNATMMIINQAERFGLSQLHQLRGRIGRGRFQGYCFLFSDAETDEGNKRLTAMEQTTDGFRIAEADFELRGPGDILGTRQHGQMPLKVADLRREFDQKMLQETRKVAFRVVEDGEFDQPEFAPTKIRVLDRFGELMDLPQTG